MTAFSRYRLCELLDIRPYARYDGNLDADPAALLMKRCSLSMDSRCRLRS
jgi:hypothetical protein